MIGKMPTLTFVGVQSCTAPEPAPIFVLLQLQHDHDTDVNFLD
jgi:hypothetical protein